MFIYDGKIYYAENKETKNDRITGGFYCTDLKGKNKKTILKKATYFPYIYNDKIYYQDDNDKCKMHVCNMDGSNDKALINNCIYQYIIDGEYIYYKAAKKMPKFNKNKRIVDEESVKYSIYRCNLDGTKDEVVVGSADVIDMAMNKNTIYYTDRNDDFRMYSMDKESGNIDLVTQSNKITNISMFEKGIYYFDYDNKGEYIDHMYYADLDGTSRNEIFGE